MSRDVDDDVVDGETTAPAEPAPVAPRPATELWECLGPWMGRLEGIDDLRARGCVVVGCSGGADSLALLALAVAHGLSVRAVHVDHGLDPRRSLDARVVASAATSLGVPWSTTATVVEPVGSLEAAARDARHRTLAQAADAAGAGAILLAHTADDQAETIVGDLLRGGGLAAVAGIPARRGAIRRPILGLRRRDTVEICRRLGLVPVDDPMNHDERHRRVWIRRRVLPALVRAADRDLVGVLARQAELAADEDAFLDELAAQRLELAGDPPVGSVIAADPLVVARRAVRRWLGPPWPSSRVVADVLAVAAGGPARVEVGAGRRVERVRGRCFVVETDVAVPEPVPVRVPGRTRFGAWSLTCWIDDAPPTAWPQAGRVAVLDADRLGRHGVVRGALAGDRVRPAGSAGSKPVAEVLAEIAVPASLRARHAVVTDRRVGRPVWVVGYRVAHDYRVTAATRRHLWISAAPRASEVR